MDILSSDFFERPTLKVAQQLIGTQLVYEHPSGERIAGRIVETEAYTQDDPACHGWGLLDSETGELNHDGRAADLFGAPGTAYVYLIYGMYWLLNVVTEPEGVGGAVLIRAVEPLQGAEHMAERRPVSSGHVNLTNGPGKLTQAFDIDEQVHGTDLTTPPLYFAAPSDEHTYEVATSSRIGITKGVERPWRFFIEDHPYVSPGVPSDRR